MNVFEAFQKIPNTSSIRSKKKKKKNTFQLLYEAVLKQIPVLESLIIFKYSLSFRSPC